jgi:hypothetical protein
MHIAHDNMYIMGIQIHYNMPNLLPVQDVKLNFILVVEFYSCMASFIFQPVSLIMYR